MSQAAVPAGSVASRLLQHIFPEVKHRCEGLVHSAVGSEIAETAARLWHLCPRQSGSFRQSLLEKSSPKSPGVERTPLLFELLEEEPSPSLGSNLGPQTLSMVSVQRIIQV